MRARPAAARAAHRAARHAAARAALAHVRLATRRTMYSNINYIYFQLKRYTDFKINLKVINNYSTFTVTFFMYMEATLALCVMKIDNRFIISKVSRFNTSNKILTRVN